MADISKITLPSGSIYNIKDAQAREDIEEIRQAIAGGLHFIGETTTVLSDGDTTNPITINGESVTAVTGDLVLSGQKEFLFDGTQWIEMGDLSLLGALAYKNSASGSYTPTGTVSQPTFTGNASTVTVTAADDANGNYQPKGTVSQPTFSGNALTSTGTFTPSGSVTAPAINVDTAGSTTVVNSITDVGTLPTFSATVANENLTLGFSRGTLPTKGSDTTVKTGDASYTATQPTFSGTQGNISVSGTPSGTVSQPTFSGTKAQISGSVTPSGTVSQPTFSGTAATITVS